MEYYATLCRYSRGKTADEACEIVATWDIGDLTSNELSFFQKEVIGVGKDEGFSVQECTVEELPRCAFWDAIYLREIKKRPFEEQFEINREINSVSDFGGDIYLATPGARVLWSCVCLADDIRAMRNDSNVVWDINDSDPEGELIASSTNETDEYGFYIYSASDDEVLSSIKIKNETLGRAAMVFAKRKLLQLRSFTGSDTPYYGNFPDIARNDPVPFDQYRFDCYSYDEAVSLAFGWNSIERQLYSVSLVTQKRLSENRGDDGFAEAFIRLVIEFLQGDSSDGSVADEKNTTINSDATPDNQVSDVELCELLAQSETWPVGLTNRRQIEWAKSIVANLGEGENALRDYVLALTLLKEKALNQKDFDHLHIDLTNAYYLATGQQVDYTFWDDVLEKLWFENHLLDMERDDLYGDTYRLSIIGRREVAKIVPPFPDDQPNDILLAVVKPDQKELPTAPIHFSPASATNGEIIPTEYCIGDEVEEVKPNDEPLPVILVNTEPIIDAIKEVGSCIERLEGYTKPAETTSEETSRWVEKRKRGMSATQIANEENKPGVKASKIQQRIGRYFKEHLDEKPEPLRTKKEQSAQ